MGIPQIGMNADGKYEVKLFYFETEEGEWLVEDRDKDFLEFKALAQPDIEHNYTLHVDGEGWITLRENGEEIMPLTEQEGENKVHFELDFQKMLNSDPELNPVDVHAYISGLGDMSESGERTGILYVRKLTNTEIVE